MKAQVPWKKLMDNKIKKENDHLLYVWLKNFR